MSPLPNMYVEGGGGGGGGVFINTYTSPYRAIRQSDARFQRGGFPETTIKLAMFYQVQKDFGGIPLTFIYL